MDLYEPPQTTRRLPETSPSVTHGCVYVWCMLLSFNIQKESWYLGRAGGREETFVKSVPSYIMVSVSMRRTVVIASGKEDLVCGCDLMYFWQVRVTEVDLE